MKLINLKSLNLTMVESKDIIKFIAQKRGINTKKLLSTIKPNPKRKNNEILTTKTHQKAAKTHQKAAKTHQEAAKTHQKAVKTHDKIKKAHKKNKKSTRKKKTLQKVVKSGKTSQKQQIMSNTEKRIEIIREKHKELRHKLSKSELKVIKKHSL